MRIARKIPIARAVPIIIQQPEASRRVGGDDGSSVSQKMFVVHELKTCCIQKFTRGYANIQRAPNT
jgi:hypothetical protein